MSRFVRSSKYRHVFGTCAKREECYDQVKITRSAWDTNKIAASTKIFAVIWEAGGGGAFVPIAYEDSGKRVPNPPLVAGHKGGVLDIDFHPFNPYIVASCSVDCTVKVWQIPEEGLKENMTEAVQELRGHKRKVGTVDFHPTANNVLASTATDYLVQLWDIEKGEKISTLDCHSNIIQSLTWNNDGSLIVTSSKDKKLRVIDPRSKEVVREADKAHEGVKGFRACTLNGRDKIATVGFARSAHRQYKVWDFNNFDKPLAKKNVDTSSGQLIPLYDQDTSTLYLGGKGDGNIRYFEITDEDKYIYPLSEYKSREPQKGLCMVPKRALDINECEIVRILKVTNKDQVQPISFKVPRKSDLFQDDIFPDTYAGVPSLTAEQWANGENADPKLMSLEPDDNEERKKEAAIQEVNFQKKAPVKQLTEKEVREEHEQQKKRIAFLEAEMKKKDAKIEELEKKVEELSN